MSSSVPRRASVPVSTGSEQLPLFTPDLPAAPVTAAPATALPADALALTCVPAWGRHQFNAPRYGWLGRAYEGLRADPHLFTRSDSTVQLAVGSKNQVQSIRFWMQAFKLTTEQHGQSIGQANTVTLTDRAHWLLHPDTGADPYLEDTITLWLLQHWLLSAPCRVPTWHVIFSRMLYTVSRDHLHRLVGRLAAESGWRSPSAKVIDEDLACLVRMYSHNRSWADAPRAHIEDIIDRPFAELGLLITPDDGQLRLTHPSPRLIPPALVAYACLDYLHTRYPAVRTISIARLASDPGGPGHTFRMRPSQLEAHLRRAAEAHPGIQVVDSVGDPVLALDGLAMPMGGHLLSTLYPRQETPFPAP